MKISENTQQPENNNQWLVVHKEHLKLGLKPSELLVYSLIYNYTQDGLHTYHGSLRTISEWIGASTNAVADILKRLIAKECITKEVQMVNGVRVCHYCANLYTPQETCIPPKKLGEGTQETWINNKYNNKIQKEISSIESISKDISSMSDIPKKNGRPLSETPCSDASEPLFNDDSLLVAKQEEERKGCAEKKETIPSMVEELRGMWNEAILSTGASIPKCRIVSESSQSKIGARLKEMSKHGEWREIAKEIIDKTCASDFLQGKSGDRRWRADFKWVFESPSNWTKIYDGRYDNGDGTPQVVNSDTRCGVKHLKESWKKVEERPLSDEDSKILAELQREFGWEK